MNSIFSYFGAKWSYAERIVQEFPLTKHYDVFVDVFGGSSAVISAAPQVDLMVYNDLDIELVNFFRVLRSPEREEFFYQVAMTPYAATEIAQTYDMQRREALIADNPMEAARLFYLRASSSFGGYKGIDGGPRGWGRALKGVNSKIDSFNNLDKLIEYAKLAKTWQIENEPYAELLKRYSNPRTLFYLDPPYLQDVCAEGRKVTYKHDLKTADEHAKLLKVICHTEGFLLLSGYESDLYATMLPGWGKVLIDGYTVLRNGDDEGGYVNEKAERTETLWLSPSIMKLRDKPLQSDIFSLIEAVTA